MKQRVLSLVCGLIAIGAALLVLGCPNAQPVPPLISDPAQIPAIGATKAPPTAVDAANLFKNACQDIWRMAEQNNGTLIGPHSGSMAQELMFDAQFDDATKGKLSLKGPVSISISRAGGFPPYSVAAIEHFTALKSKCDIQGSCTKLLTSFSNRTMSGSLYQKLDTDVPFSINITEVAADALRPTKYSLSSKGQSAGTVNIALSIKDDTGMGAKFILTASPSYGPVDKTTTEADEASGSPSIEIPSLQPVPKAIIPAWRPPLELHIKPIATQKLHVIYYKDDTNEKVDEFDIELGQLPFSVVNF